MDLRQLRYFVVVAEELNFTRAAERLHVAQPPLSRTIRQLEAELGTALFTRDTRHVALTAAGEAFLVEARPLLDGAERAVRAARQPDVQVRLALPEPLNVGWVAAVIHDFHLAHPRIALRLHEQAEPARLARDLLRGRVDAGFQVDGVPADLDALLLPALPLGALLPTGHGLAAQAHVTLAELTRSPLLLPARHLAPAAHDTLMARLAAEGLRPRLHALDHLYARSTLAAMVAGGEGLTLTAHRPAFDLPESGVAWRPVTPPLTVRPWLAWSPRRVSAPLALFLAFVRAQPGVDGGETAAD